MIKEFSYLYFLQVAFLQNNSLFQSGLYIIKEVYCLLSKQTRRQTRVNTPLTPCVENVIQDDQTREASEPKTQLLKGSAPAVPTSVGNVIQLSAATVTRKT